MSNARADEYRQKAEECRLQAANAGREEDKAAWLELAEDWQRLARSIDAIDPLGSQRQRARE